MYKIPNVFKIVFSYSQFFDKFLYLKILSYIIDYLIHYVNFEMWTTLFYVNYLSYFQQWNLN